MAKRKKRVFIHISKKGKLSKICAISEDEKHLFNYEFEDKIDDYENIDGVPAEAVKAFNAFETFCKEECGFKRDCEFIQDEVIFVDGCNYAIMDISSYIELEIGGADWAVGQCIEFSYKYETTHIESPLTFKAFKKACDIGLPEPYASKHLYNEYRRLIHKDTYSGEELDRMEHYVSSHLNNVFRSRRVYRHGIKFIRNGDSDVEFRIAHICAVMYKSDMSRFLRLVESIVSDYKRRRSECKQNSLMNILDSVAEEVEDDSAMDYYADYSYLEEDEKKPPIDRKEYGIFRGLAPWCYDIIKELLEENE